MLVVLGVMLALYPLFTYLYSYCQQYALITQINQTAVEQIENPALIDRHDIAPPLTGDFKNALLEIPAINVKVAVLRGTSDAILAKGPGWYEESALPGHGNTAIAGHRTMYGAWFRHLDSLQQGDPIILVYEDNTFVYLVEQVFVVASDDWSVIEPSGYPVLTLTTCHPVGSAKQRLVVRATLETRSTI